MKFYDMINQTIKNTKKKMKLNNASNKVFKDNYIINFFWQLTLKLK